LPLDLQAAAPDELDLAVQSTGKLLVSATVANATNPSDRDVAVVRLDTNGTLDATFGVAGVRVLDLSTAHDNAGTLVGLDGARDLAVGADDAIYLHANSRAAGTTSGGTPRTDTDFTVVKLTANGAQDLTFAGDGMYTLDLQESGATPRGINVLADGTVLATGYANSPGLGSTQPVMYKLTAAGALVPGFATGGVFHDIVLAVQTEIYNVAIHGNQVVTAGYGRAQRHAERLDLAALRRHHRRARPRLRRGDRRHGADRSQRHDGRRQLPQRDRAARRQDRAVGSTGSGVPAQDAAFAILDADGRLDTTYGTGVFTLPLGANGADQFWGGAVSGDHALLVGYQGGGAPADRDHERRRLRVAPAAALEHRTA
jgi:uncharacterized delta-60 repeat protein